MHTYVGGEFHQKALIDLIKSKEFIVAHNAKFELQWLARCGMDLSTILCYDTMLGEWVIAGNRHIPKDLDSTARRYGVGVKESNVSRLIKNGVNPLNIPVSWLSTYCEQDVSITKEIFLQQRQVLAERNQLHIIYSRCLLTPVLADIETNGVTLDKKEVYDEYERVREAFEREQRSLDVLYRAVEESRPEFSEENFIPINWRSRKQVGEFLYDKLKFPELQGKDGTPARTDSGQRRTDSASIEKLKATTKRQKDFIRGFKEVAKLSAKLSKTLEFFKAVCEEYDGTFYGIFNQGSTATHRLSSSGRKILARNGEEYSAQLQNMPREYKRLVCPKRAGYSILEIDGSGLEFRVAADLGHDKVAYEEIVNGADIHSVTAETLTKAGEPTTRQDAKSRTFRPLYGGRSGTKAEQAYCKFFQNKYKEIYTTQTEWTFEVLRTGELRTPYGMIFYWPGTRMSSHGFIDNTTSIFNYPVQGLATAEIIPVALVHAWHKLQHMDVRIILTIHDSIVMEVGPDVDREELYNILFDSMTKDVYRFMEMCYTYKVWIVLGAGLKEGPHWGSGTEIKRNIPPTTEV